MEITDIYFVEMNVRQQSNDPGINVDKKCQSNF